MTYDNTEQERQHCRDGVLVRNGGCARRTDGASVCGYTSLSPATGQSARAGRVSQLASGESRGSGARAEPAEWPPGTARGMGRR